MSVCMLTKTTVEVDLAATLNMASLNCLRKLLPGILRQFDCNFEMWQRGAGDVRKTRQSALGVP